MLSVPSYMLYGESGRSAFPGVLHCESIPARSRLHNWRIGPHRHHGLWQFLWIGSGGGEARFDNGSRELQAGAAIIVPPLAVHGFNFHPGTEGFVVTVPQATFKPVAGTGAILAGAAACPFVVAGNEQVASAMRAIAGEYAAPCLGHESMLTALVTLLAVWFARASNPADPSAQNGEARKLVLFRRFQAILEERYSDHLPLGHYARELSVTPAHLSRICRELAGRSAQALLHERLLLEAKRLLAFTALPVQAIATDLGFADAAYFTRFFSERVGRSPGAFRRGTATRTD